MKRVLLALTIITTALLTGCGESEAERQLRLERAHEVRMAKINSGQAAIEDQQYHERQLARINRPIMPIAPGNYIDYRGNTSYGYWDTSGSWAWNDRESEYARSSRSYYDYQIATGASTAALIYAVNRNSYMNNNPSGWTNNKTVIVNNYTSVKGETLDKAKYTASVKKKTVAVNKWKSSRPTTKPKPFTSKYAKGKDGKTAEAKRRDAFKKKPVVANKPKTTPVKPSTYAKSKPPVKKSTYKAPTPAKKYNSSYSKKTTPVKKSTYKAPKKTYKAPKPKPKKYK